MKYQTLFKYSSLLLLFILFILFMGRPLGLIVVPVPTEEFYPIKLPYQITLEPLTITVIAVTISIISFILGVIFKRNREASFLNIVDIAIGLFTIVTTGGLIL